MDTEVEREKVVARNTDLSDSDVSGSDMSYSDYRGSNFSRANMRGVKLIGCKLGGCNFAETQLSGESLCGVDTRLVKLRGSYIDGEKLHKEPIVINGLPWFVLITDNYMRLGCERHTHEEWRKFRTSNIEKMGVGAVAIFKRYREVLLALCDLHQPIKKVASAK